MYYKRLISFSQLEITPACFSIFLHYFHKSASALSAEECGFLAAIIPNPRKWGRWPPGPYIQRRKNIILARIGYSKGTPPDHQEDHQEDQPAEEESLDDVVEDNL